jgi:hypothetical protein
MSPTDHKTRSTPSRLGYLGVLTAVTVNLVALVGYAVKTGEAVGSLAETSKHQTEDIVLLREADEKTADRIEQQYKALAEMAGDIKAIRQAIDDDRRHSLRTP